MLDYNTSFEDPDRTENYDTEADEEDDPIIFCTKNEKELENDALLRKCSLEYMTNVNNFYDEIEQTTRNRKHTWKTPQHRLRRVFHLCHLARFRRTGVTKFCASVIFFLLKYHFHWFCSIHYFFVVCRSLSNRVLSNFKT